MPLWRQYIVTHSDAKEGCRRTTCCHTFARIVIAHLRRDIIRNSRWIRLSNTYNLCEKSVSVQLSVYTNTPDYKKAKGGNIRSQYAKCIIASSCIFYFFLIHFVFGIEIALRENMKPAFSPNLAMYIKEFCGTQYPYHHAANVASAIFYLK